MLKLSNVSFSYKKAPNEEELVIKDLSCEFGDTGIYAIMGPSGKGKTTLFSLISGLLKPASGSISGNTEKLSAVFQDSVLLPWMTALENVNFVLGGKKNTLPIARDALCSVGLGGSENKYPEELSGGMQRRTALARALAYDGDIYLLDEPFTGLDTEIKSDIMKQIKDIGKSKLVLLITHDLSEALECTAEIVNFDEING